MKIVYFLFASVLLFINCRDQCYMMNASKSDCTDYTLDEEDKQDADSCCFVKMKGSYEGYSGEVKMCQLFKKEEVVDIVKETKKQDGVDSFSVDCSSNWLSKTLLFAIFALCF